MLCEVGDEACFQNCAREYDKNLENCPCQEKCPTGCPCPDYQCPTRTTADLETWVLVLKGGPNANFFSSYVKKWIRLGQKWSPKKFQSDYVIMGSTEVKLVKK